MPRKARNLVGEKFGSLLVTSREGNNQYGSPLWRCVCDCGNEAVKQSGDLLGGMRWCSKSCAVKPGHRTTHGQRYTALYQVWHRMKDRCYRETNPSYASYGGRGIAVCDEWRNSFEAFAAYVGEPLFLGAELDRYPNNDGNYEPGNVRWATRKEQANNRRSNRVLEWEGRSKTVQEWGEYFGIDPQLIRNRLRHGWAVPRVFSTEDNRRRK
ncbi:hypothetical protein D3C87_1017220 [compost metagenome]